MLALRYEGATIAEWGITRNKKAGAGPGAQIVPLLKEHLR